MSYCVMPWLWLALSTNASYSAASSAGQKFIEFLGSFYFLSYYLIMNWLGRHGSFASLSITAWWARNNYEENQSINLQNPLKPHPYNHPFNLNPEKGFEGYLVKSTQIFIRYLELVYKELNHFGGIGSFFRDWAPGTLTGGAF